MLHLLAANDDVLVPRKPRPGVASASLNGLKILLVEDNLVNQEVAKGMLASIHADVAVVSNGQDALDTLECEYFDIVLMDCQMPVLDGYQATKAIRDSEGPDAESRQTIIALTANALAEDRERCLAAGMDDYLSKPFTIDKLREMLERWSANRLAKSA
jgi:CheY-like chemotaxis protein